tara:strand:+ start:31 stop:858 length:828 start_codon:yes stop_codon:yes gene_type:complete
MFKKFNLKDGTFIRYETIGKGPPILLLHTFRNRLEYFYEISKTLKKKYKLYLLDLPGFGESPINNNTKYDEEFFTDCIVEFVKFNKLSNLIIAGESIGGVLPITVSIKLPKKIKKIFLFNPYDYDNYFGEGISRGNIFAKFILFNISLPLIGNLFSSLENKFILKNIMRGGFVNTQCLSNDYIELLCLSLKKTNYVYHFRNVLINSKSWANARKIYKKVTVPVELTYGEKDWSNENDRKLTKELLGLDNYITLENCSHFSFLEKPKEVAEIISKG